MSGAECPTGADEDKDDQCPYTALHNGLCFLRYFSHSPLIQAVSNGAEHLENSCARASLRTGAPAWLFPAGVPGVFVPC